MREGNTVKCDRPEFRILGLKLRLEGAVDRLLFARTNYPDGGETAAPLFSRIPWS